ncbi:hypothetical protein LPJ64_001722 [Coemansia asiatica]|uniref:RING-type domain-containing protein n=1 Tax=Coemansia asiatica TaxID=1052880 RepID=A0A9W7XMY7_9FUNG|nr:hypothetical protein LPJ64_001722 [Coemansia asiatica]
MEFLPIAVTKTTGTGGGGAAAAAAAAMVATVATSPDVWQQLQGFQAGPRFTWLVDYIAAIPELWGPWTATTQKINTAVNGLAITAAEKTITATTPTQQLSSEHIMSMALPVAPEGTQLFGLFVSRYFLLALLIGFVISRIHVLVHRQRVRPLGVWPRIAVYLPTHLLLLRALTVICVALEKNSRTTPNRTKPWMQMPIGYASRVAREHRWIGIGEETAGDVAHALWLSFATICLFDCVDVFVARLEGSPCAPYEYIGGLIERTSLYYFYGGSLRIQELVLLSVLEKLLLSHTLLLVTNGWQWRLVPTGIANLLTLHHFFFSMRNYTGSQAMYPFVQVLSMVLLGMSLLIVVTTVSIRWLAFTIDRLGIKRRHMSTVSSNSGGQDGIRGAVAVYDRNGAFQGVRQRNGTGPSIFNAENDGRDNDIDDEGDDDSLYELAQYSSLPLFPDLRRDFGVEILDLAGTCLQQYSSQIRSSGFSRQYGAMRVPLSTALDEYIDRAVARIDNSEIQRVVGNLSATERARRQRKPNRQKQQRLRTAKKAGGSGLSVFIDDEPNEPVSLQPSSASIAAALHDTRADAARRLSVAVWSLCIALASYALNRKMHMVEESPLDDHHRARRFVASRQTERDISMMRCESHNNDDDDDDGFSSNQDEEEEFFDQGTRFTDVQDYSVDVDVDDDEDDFDYVAKDSESESDIDSDTEIGSSDTSSDSEEDFDLLSEPKSTRFNEAAELVCDLLDNPGDGDPGSQLAAAAAFVAHSLLDSIFPGHSNSSNGTRPRVMTRGMIARQLSNNSSQSSGDGDPALMMMAPETLLVQMLSRISTAGLDQSGVIQQTMQQGEPLPFIPSEVESLAHLIQTRRQQHRLPVQERNSDEMSGMVGDTVLCVICWANARSVMLRPCRCLCLCNDCRLALAARSFDHCPCCRRSVCGYSRVYAV